MAVLIGLTFLIVTDLFIMDIFVDDKNVLDDVKQVISCRDLQVEHLLRLFGEVSKSINFYRSPSA